MSILLYEAPEQSKNISYIVQRFRVTVRNMNGVILLALFIEIVVHPDTIHVDIIH